jgi:hypothetical protein
VFLEGRQRRKWTDKRQISLNHCFRRLYQFILDLKFRLIFHGEVGEKNVFWPVSASICTSFSVTFFAAFFAAFSAAFLGSLYSFERVIWNLLSLLTLTELRVKEFFSFLFHVCNNNKSKNTQTSQDKCRNDGKIGGRQLGDEGQTFGGQEGNGTSNIEQTIRNILDFYNISLNIILKAFSFLKLLIGLTSFYFFLLAILSVSFSCLKLFGLSTLLFKLFNLQTLLGFLSSLSSFVSFGFLLLFGFFKFSFLTSFSCSKSFNFLKPFNFLKTLRMMKSLSFFKFFFFQLNVLQLFCCTCVDMVLFIAAATNKIWVNSRVYTNKVLQYLRTKCKISRALRCCPLNFCACVNCFCHLKCLIWLAYFISQIFVQYFILRSFCAKVSNIIKVKCCNLAVGKRRVGDGQGEQFDLLVHCIYSTILWAFNLFCVGGLYVGLGCLAVKFTSSAYLVFSAFGLNNLKHYTKVYFKTNIKAMTLIKAAAISKIVVFWGRLTNIKQYIKVNFKTNLIQHNCLVCVSNIKQYIEANFETNIKAMPSIKAAAINIILLCKSNLKHLKVFKFNYKIFKKVAKRFKSLASPGSTSTIALNISQLLSDIPLDGFFIHTTKVCELIDSARSTLNAIGIRYGNLNYRYSFNWKILCMPGGYLFFISSAMMLSLTIYLTLLAQGVESQPGPKDKRSTLSILTSNCNGLGDPK